MLFNSYVFIIGFLPVAWLGFFAIARADHRLAALWLAFASIFFYGWWNAEFVLLLLTSICFNYSAGVALGRCRRQGRQSATNRLLAAAIAGNLLLLVFYKYAGFFTANLNVFFDTSFAISEVILPLGISFFTFTQIAFLVDVSRGLAREYNFIHYVLFVTYFPHLIAGPILHHANMMPQFGHPETYRPQSGLLSEGVTFFTIGLFKKVVLADQLALYADSVFSVAGAGGEPEFFEAWIGAVAYSLQLYFDFSGYSDMAVGLSKMFNINLPFNFDSPYKARSIIEFWRRWHMTLSAFLRDYLYVPLGGNRDGVFSRHLNLMITMLLGGLWHGANWTFVVWGGLHGIFLIVNHAWREMRGRLAMPSIPGESVLSVLVTFILVVIGWVVFRSSDLAAAARMLEGMAGYHGAALPVGFDSRFPLLAGCCGKLSGTALSGVSIADSLLWITLGMAIVWLLPNTQQWISSLGRMKKLEGVPGYFFFWAPTRRFGVLVGVVFAITLLRFNKNSPFLYFQF